MPVSPLVALERSRLAFGAAAAAARLALLRPLARSSLGSAPAVRRLHEALCWIRAYPDNAAVLEQAVAMLEGFARRADLRRHRAALADSGIAGTAIHYRFFAGQAQWLASRWPEQLRLDRSDAESEARIARALPVLLTRAEAAALAEAPLPGYAAIDRLRGAAGDAAFLLGRIAALPGDGFTREAFSDAVDAAYRLEPAPGTPSRTLAYFAPAPLVFRSTPPPRQRPDLRAELARPARSVRRLARAGGEALVDLARAAMVTRARSLEAFSFADPGDAWLVDDGDGLAFGFAGVIPERRHALAATYGALTLRNGVPIGYAQADIVGRSAALSFNTFETFRGGEAAFVFARWLAALRHLFGSTSFSIEPYQLGRHNDEALESGAWWFYARLGFAPRDAAVAALAAHEHKRLSRPGARRSPRATLARLAQRHLHFDLDPRAPLPRVPLDALGLQIGAALSAETGADRNAALDACSARLQQRCGLAGLRGFNPSQREAWRRFAPIVEQLDTVGWRSADWQALAGLLRAKGGANEREYLRRFLAHPRLDAALLAWSRQQDARAAAGAFSRRAPPAG